MQLRNRKLGVTANDVVLVVVVVVIMGEEACRDDDGDGER